VPGKDNQTGSMLANINQQGLNRILHYEDVSSMNQSIEIRSPFVDYRLMEFSFSIPTDLKLKQGVTKRILRETVGKMLPDSIRLSRSKIGFQTPFHQ
jgi:asparagine synthase (glutamine-hydrolysing)